MEELLKNQKSLIISSLGEDKSPQISYAPFVMIDDKIYVYLSRVAEHYYNLRDNKDCSVMLIEDESKCRTIFARTRLSFQCEATLFNGENEKIFEEFDRAHDPKVMSMLKNMDFELFELNIKIGRLVKGFGQAVDVRFENGEYTCTQVTEIARR